MKRWIDEGWFALALMVGIFAGDIAVYVMTKVEKRAECAQIEQVRR